MARDVCKTSKEKTSAKRGTCNIMDMSQIKDANSD